MTKTLTEQLKDMDLADEHLYYWRMPNGEVRIMNKISVCSYKLCYDGGDVDILAPVPSYEEWKQLDDELKELATKNDTLAMENGRLEKQLSRMKSKEYIVKVDWFSPDPVGFLTEKQTKEMFGSWKKKKGVK